MGPLVSGILLGAGLACASAPAVEHLSDLAAQGRLEHDQAWGVLGLDIAARSSGPRKPIRIGKTVFKKGLGHHAGGRITVALGGAYQAFDATIGVQWQGGKRGSVRFRVLLDGKPVFQCGPMSDSDPARAIHIPLTGATELCLVAEDNGDGIGCDMANWADARLTRDPDVRLAAFGPATATFGGRPAPTPSLACAGGLSLAASDDGPQVLLMGEPVSRVLAAVQADEQVRVRVPVTSDHGALRVAVDVALRHGREADVRLSLGGAHATRRLAPSQTLTLEAGGSAGKAVVLAVQGRGVPAAVCLTRARYRLGDGRWLALPLRFARHGDAPLPPPRTPELRPAVCQELIEWDWRMHDGVGAPREARLWPEAIDGVLACGDRLVANLKSRDAAPADLVGQWRRCHVERRAMSAASDEAAWEGLWRRVHTVRRRLVFADPVVPKTPILFVKRVPSRFSHQLTQYYGMWARPGGGVFVLEAPGESMRCRELTRDRPPVGSYQHPELSYDGRRVLFAYCKLDSVKKQSVAGRQRNADAYYHLYEMGVDGHGLRQITSGPFDDFSPTLLPNGRILFTSTRRGGYHRCGRGPCPVYTLASVNPDGSDPRVLSRHETHEWDPAVLHDGRVIYTRWDYVDRNAVYYQQLWTTRPDGTAPAEYFGNYLRNPVGIWEARPIPGSTRVMATAAAHHAMTAGSIVRIDVTRGQDNPEAITRLTPDAPFPESECMVRRRPTGGRGWRGSAGVRHRRPLPSAAKRWPGHCYRSPYPLSETTFLAAYSYDPLIGEPSANAPNMFGLYVVDCFGNRELLYRDPNIGSLWPIPVRARSKPDTAPSVCEDAKAPTGVFVVQDVHRAYPALPGGEANRVRRLRIVQVLPKTTPHANNPRVGQANASPGKQVLGTVPVEADGSAYFRAPAHVALAFQALDGRGRAIQSMRSLTYLQPGERISCVGCHEPRLSAPPNRKPLLALARAPSAIAPGPDGSKPLSYPLLVQPVLDRHCVGCHSGAAPAGGVALTGKPAKRFTESYNHLVRRVSYSAWGRRDNSEPLSRPDHFGARGSRLMRHLSAGHKNVRLTDDDLDRLITWMDTTALFYGTFKPADQARQKRGERIEGPDLE